MVVIYSVTCVKSEWEYIQAELNESFKNNNKGIRK